MWAPLVCPSGRNINYENLDAFLCNECGHSRFGRFDFGIAATRSYDFPPPACDADVAPALAAFEAEADQANKLRSTLAALHRCGGHDLHFRKCNKTCVSPHKSSH
jgi:hypothetical protein